ncbi:hypothetical protein LOTGIDRAFT_235620 [Lottia gigantea]|uniref:Uncharacterized protein n=1 Tax=Lottia gigantea TaxID=225164 RepID=V4BAM3_LOTGI|nr:hypothetical protein LOTGIDRAFT_235620 [Lottia gigantea]ESO86029.1 hypothetical protein LOTGIDRAFT_235620 [Lottia gigantea]
MAGKPSSSCLVDWEVLIPLGPTLAFHVGCVVNNSVYLHGGIEIKGSNSPCNKLYKLDLESLIWNQIVSPDSPVLSHHACLVRDDRYMIIIGGWDGKSRGSRVYVYDTVENKWSEPPTTGFPEDGGLSSHTVNELSDGKILIVGRDGSLRMQRRHGNAYLMAGDQTSGFKYSEFSNSVTSRSGHTTSIIGTKVFIIGGRSDKLVDVYTGYSNKYTHANSVIENLVSAAGKLKALHKFPSGRKHHISLPVPGGLFLHGGETFDGKCREPVGDMYLMTVKPVGNFYKLGTSSVGRSGHVCLVYKDKVLLHGGISGKNSSIRCETFELKLKF